MSQATEGRAWTYPHVDLGEQPLPDGSQILRPRVRLARPGGSDDWIGVVDSGAPLSTADSAVLRGAGVDLAAAEPVMMVRVSLGGASSVLGVFMVELDLLPPDGIGEPPLRWRAELAAAPRWHLPFGVLLGQRGWFDRFPTTIDATSTTVHLPSVDPNM